MMANQNSGGNQADLYDSTITSGTMGRPSNVLSPSDNAPSASNAMHQRTSCFVGMRFSPGNRKPKFLSESRRTAMSRPMPTGAASASCQRKEQSVRLQLLRVRQNLPMPARHRNGAEYHSDDDLSTNESHRNRHRGIECRPKAHGPGAVDSGKWRWSCLVWVVPHRRQGLPARRLKFSPSPDRLPGVVPTENFVRRPRSAFRASLAACTPFTHLRSRRIAPASSPSLRVAARKTSGAGFLCTTSSAVTMASHISGGRPIFFRLALSLMRSALEATATFSPAFLQARTSSTAPGKALSLDGTSSR